MILGKRLNESFKPCYKWITFNTLKTLDKEKSIDVCFKPCYKWITFNTKIQIQKPGREKNWSFKPCYKWITFNT